MKVILHRDIPKVGKKFEVVDVASGYANNYLFTRGLAERSTPERERVLEASRAAHAAAEDAKIADLKERIAGLAETPLTITVKADDQGHLFKKVRLQDITEALKDDLNIELEAESVLLERPLDEIGEHVVKIDAAGMTVDLKVVLVKD